MEDIAQKIKLAVKKAWDITPDDLVLSSVPENQQGDLSTNVAMTLARKLRRSPKEIATKIVDLLNANEDDFTAIVAGNGFINLSFSGQQLLKRLQQAWRSDYGNNEDGKGKKALIEFPSTNIAKPYSVGHLRPGTQGWAAKMLYEACGYHVITDNHLGDTGTPFGVWAIGFLKSGKALSNITIYDLGDIYIKTKKALKDEAEAGKHELADAVQDWLLKLEAKDPEATKLYRSFYDISMKHTHDVMARLGISTDYELGESNFVTRGKNLIKKYLKAGIFTKNADGSIVCRLDDYGIDVPILLQKSNGAALYATTDLGCLDYRAKVMKIDEAVYAVGAEQKFYFEQLFALGKKLHYPQHNIHLYFGTIDQVDDSGKRAKMSSRKGVVLMEDMLNDAERRVRANFRGDKLSDADVNKIAVGAIKFSDFIADRKTGILYDPDKIFALSGFSGPFCQYAAVRLGRILAKAAETDTKANKTASAKTLAPLPATSSTYDANPEKPIALLLLDFPNVVRRACEKLDAHQVAVYAFTLAQALNRYYEQASILSAPSPEIKALRLDLVKKAHFVLVRALSLLGVEVPSQM